MTATDLAQAFDHRRYAVWRSLVAAAAAQRLSVYARKRADAGTLTARAVDEAEAAGGDFFMDGLLADIAPRVERATGISVWPTYSYLRVYRHGDVLRKHTDRPACEISLTLCLGFDGDAPWPIWIEGPQGSASIALAPGDALLYRGIECPHWREPLDGGWAAQVFLHYVDRRGPHAGWKFDKRDSLAELPFPSARRDSGAGG